MYGVRSDGSFGMLHEAGRPGWWIQGLVGVGDFRTYPKYTHSLDQDHHFLSNLFFCDRTGFCIVSKYS